MTRNLRIGDLAIRTATAAPTIRYYEQAGLMPSPRRGMSNQRVYGLADVDRLQFIRRCRALGFTLKEIRTFVRLARSTSHDGCRAIVTRRLAEVQASVRELQAVESRLRALLAKESDADCSALEVLAPSC